MTISEREYFEILEERDYYKQKYKEVLEQRKNELQSKLTEEKTRLSILNQQLNFKRNNMFYAQVREDCAI